MGTTGTPTAADGRVTGRTAGRPWRLSGNARKSTLVVHVVSAVGWLGADVVLLVLAVTGLTSDDRYTVAASYQAMGVFVVPTLVVAALLTLAGGVLLGLGSKYGLLRYRWVVTKLVITLVLTTLVLVLLRPSVHEVAATGRELATADDPAGALDRLGELGVGMLFPPAVSIAALTLATVLSLFKPWGRTARGRRATGR